MASVDRGVFSDDENNVQGGEGNSSHVSQASELGGPGRLPKQP